MDSNIEKKLEEYQRKDDKSWKFLLFMAYVSTVLLVLLNIYIAYILYLYFTKDGFSLAGGLFIAAFYILTLPANYFSARMIRNVKAQENPAPFFYLALGTATALAGIILQNASPHWIYIFLYGLLLAGISAICMILVKKEG
jgi:hypothetical protein